MKIYFYDHQLHGRVGFRIYKSKRKLRKAVKRLTALSCWFEVMPYPDDQWHVTVKREMVGLAFPLKPLVLTP